MIERWRKFPPRVGRYDVSCACFFAKYFGVWWAKVLHPEISRSLDFIFFQSHKPKRKSHIPNKCEKTNNTPKATKTMPVTVGCPPTIFYVVLPSSLCLFMVLKGFVKGGLKSAEIEIPEV
tara:strand:- start:211 stop:570 length:360 start_codon:yes stop_codon:yes gene_type:complete